MRSQLIYSNLVTRQPAASVSGDTLTLPTVTAGEQYRFSLRFLDSINGSISEIFPTVRAIRAAVGKIDARPDGGTVALQYGPGPSTAANTTEPISAADSADTIKRKLHALVAVEDKNFDISSTAGSFLIRRTDGAQFSLTIRNNRLTPVSFARLRSWNDLSGAVTEMRFVQSPVAFSDSAAQVLPEEPYWETIFDGYADASFVQNEEQVLTIPLAFRGQYSITYGLLKSGLLSRADGNAQIKAAMDSLLAAEGGTVTVTNPAKGKARAVIGGDLSGVDIAQFGIYVPIEGTPPGDWTLTLDFNTFEAWSAIRSTSSIELPFEVEIDVPEDESDPGSPSKTIKLWQTKLTLRAPLTWEGLATAQPVDWLRKPNPKTYLPYNQTQVLFANRGYETSIGDGVGTSFEIDHNLGAVGLSGITLTRKSTGDVLIHGIDYQLVSANEGNTLEVTLSEAAAVGDILVTISLPYPVETFINDLQISIEQVATLPDVLSNLGTRLATVEAAVLATTNPGKANSSTGLLIDVLEKKEVLFLDSSAESPFGEKGLDLEKLPDPKTEARPPYLLPAVHDAVVADWPGGDPDPADFAGQVFVNAGAESIDLSGAGGIRGTSVPPGGFIACDGRLFYACRRSGTTNSYYPVAFERPLFQIPINELMLSAGQVFTFPFAVKLQSAFADCPVRWVIALDLGTPAAETVPSPLGINLGPITWADPFILQGLDVTEQAVSHPFGVRIARSSSAITMDRLLYSRWLPATAAAPASANFILRGQLLQLDTPASFPDARGWLTYQLIPPPTSDSDTETKLQASIS